jgi:iron complex outermembrane receptor protein
MKKLALLLLCGTTMLLDATTAVAQSAQGAAASVKQDDVSAELAPVTVTARRTEESLQAVPVSVVAITKLQLENNDATDLSKLAELAPQVIIGEVETGTGAALAIRGISSGSSDSGLDQSVLVVFDGVPLSRGRVVTLSTFDIQQVEIMEGPQALFFGKNSPAGVISIASVDPTDVFGGYAKAGYEFIADEGYAEAAVSGPIVDHLDARLAVRADYQDGWIHNVATPVADPFHPGVTDPGAIAGRWQPGGHETAGRLTVVWSPTENFDAKLKLTVDQQTQNGGNAYGEPFCVGNVVPVVLGVRLPEINCQKNMTVAISGLAPEFAANFPYGNGGKPYQDMNLALASATLNERLSDVTLTSTTGFYDQSISDSGTYDWSPFATIYQGEHEHYQLVTQELRANTTFSFPVNFMTGVYYEHSNRPWFNAPDLFNLGINPSVNNYTTAETTATTTSTSYSAFAQLRWNIIPTVELAAGARYTHDEKTLTIENIANNPAAAYLGIDLYPQGQVLRAPYSSDNASPEVTLSWHPEPDQTLYGAYKTGYLAGGLSNSDLLEASATPGNIRFGSESSKGGEIGYKADLANHTLRLDLTGYYYNYNGLQVASYDPATLSFPIGNASKARTKGVEGTLQWLAMKNLTFNASFGYNLARYLSFPAAPCYDAQTPMQGCINGVQSLGGQPLILAPDITFDLGGDYRMNFAAGWTADLTMDGAYTSSYQTASDNNPGGTQSAFWRLNAAVHVRPENGNYEFAIIGRDLTNSYYLISTTSQTAGNPGQFDGLFARPREVILEATYHY